MNHASLALGVALSLCCAAAAAGDPLAGEPIYAACAGCHGVRGEGHRAVGAPRLAGLDEAYLERQLNYFRSGIRGGPEGAPAGAAMAAVASALNARDVSDVAAHIAALRSPPAAPTVSGDADNGRVLYGACAACHGAAAEGNPALHSPALRGMNDWYLVEQLEQFRSGQRGAHPDDVYGRQMAQMVAVLSDRRAAIDVVTYINSLKP